MLYHCQKKITRKMIRRPCFLPSRILFKCLVLTLLLQISQFLPKSNALGPTEVLVGEELEASESAVGEVSVAEPNLGALLGLRSTVASSGALPKGLGGSPLTPSGGSVQSLIGNGALSSICNGGGNSDSLANLLVYQYLSGSLPTADEAGLGQADSPQVDGKTPELRTTTSVTTTLTTRTVTMDASTKYSTSTKSFITTVTTVTSSVLPIIFRGSKITTTITDRVTEVLTATEFHTSSSVSTPKIIQTLNVEITLRETSTKGPNGLFTLAQVTPGATKVLDKPISLQTIGLDPQDIYLSSLSGLGPNTEKAQVVNALTALLQQYSEDGDITDGGAENLDKNQGRNFGTTRFHNRARFTTNGDSAPKYNVLRGFTLSDREPTKKAAPDNSGSALENTRYSKFRKKNNLQGNSISPEQDKENERYSASTSRRTISRTSDRHRDIYRRSSKRIPSGRSIDHSTNRAAGKKRRHFRRSLFPVTNYEPISLSPKSLSDFKANLLTKHMLLDLSREQAALAIHAARSKRHVNSYHDTAKSKHKTDMKTSFSTIGPEHVVQLLQDVDREVVRKMLYSLKDWIDYYIHQILGEEKNTPSISKRQKTSTLSLSPSLHSNDIRETIGFVEGPTRALPVQTKSNSFNLKPSESKCQITSAITNTVYKTIYITQT